MKNRKGITYFKNLIFKSEFSKNVFTLISGTAIAQLIPLLVAPILSRIYTPSEFGRLALYLSVVQILGAISSGRYELAIILPKKEKKAVQLTLLAIIITISVSLVSLILVVLFSNVIASFLGDPKLSKWLYLVPVSVLMMGIFNALNYFNTREKEFKNIAKANVYKALGGNITQLVLGLIKSINGGLIIGQVFSHFYGNIKMAKTFFNYKTIIKKTSKKDLKKLAKRYIDFPKFSTWGIFLNLSAINIVNIFISTLYGLTFLGFFAHAYKYLGLPTALLGNSFSQVYMQNLSSAFKNKQNTLRIFKNTLTKISLISLVFLVGGFLFIEEAFVIFFGKEWQVAGVYAKYLLPLFSIRFVVSCLSISLTVIEQQKRELFVHLSILVFTLIVYVLCIICNLDIDSAIKLYSLILSITYLFILYYIYYLLKKTS